MVEKVLNEVVDNLDLSVVESSYMYSGRKMETLLRRDVNFMWLSGMQTPDFNTINLFRKNRLSAVIDDIFTQVVR